MADLRNLSDRELRERYAEVALLQDHGFGLTADGRAVLVEAQRRGWA